MCFLSKSLRRHVDIWHIRHPTSQGFRLQALKKTLIKRKKFCSETRAFRFLRKQNPLNKKLHDEVFNKTL